MIGVLLVFYAVVALAYGLWTHDWTVIGSSIALLLAWPLISEGVFDERRRRRELDRLWNDDNLSTSA